MKFAFLLLAACALPAAERQPVLVELFTSEGCSSCPPADRLLQDLERRQPVPGALVIALSEHVDYWNSLGWRDPFSSRQFSLRQQQYVRAMHLESNYTPQMVVDGRFELVGGNAGKAADAIARATGTPKAEIQLEWRAGKLAVHVSRVPADGDWRVMLAVTESGLRSSVAAGENSGRTLEHTAVVRSLREAGTVRAGEFHADLAVVRAKEWNSGHWSAVVFVQDAQTRQIAGANLAPWTEGTAAPGRSLP